MAAMWMRLSIYSGLRAVKLAPWRYGAKVGNAVAINDHRAALAPATTFTNEQVELIKRTIAVGATTDNCSEAMTAVPAGTVAACAIRPTG